MKTVMIGIARMGSTRLPGKVMRKLGYKTVIDWVVGAGYNAPGIDEVCIATSALAQDDVIVDWCKDHDIPCFRGSETDVLSRFTGAMEVSGADIAVRVTCDCPFLDPQVIGEVVALHKATGASYTCNNEPPTYPDGLDCEAVSAWALRLADKYARLPSDRDTVTQYIVRHPRFFPPSILKCPIPGLEGERWVLDTQLDWEFCEALVAGGIRPGDSYLTILDYLNKHPELRKINEGHPRNERFFEALAQEENEGRS